MNEIQRAKKRHMENETKIEREKKVIPPYDSLPKELRQPEAKTLSRYPTWQQKPICLSDVTGIQAESRYSLVMKQVFM